MNVAEAHTRIPISRLGTLYNVDGAAPALVSLIGRTVLVRAGVESPHKGAGNSHHTLACDLLKNGDCCK
jgi:hypothetical protein